jgi:predicted phosphoribosyltransferase
VAADGTLWRNEDAIAATGADDDYIDRKRSEEAEAARRKADRYRDDGRPELAGTSVVVVDDGVATGSTARACLELIRAEDPERVVLAVPVGPPDTIADLEAVADEVVCLETPQGFRGVGQFYEVFDQVTDEEAIDYLDRRE